VSGGCLFRLRLHGSRLSSLSRERLCVPVIYDLLILDDLGAERGTEYALEQVFAVIDARYRSRKPLVVTTNLTLDALKHPDDLAHARIYDRILEICAPILFGGENLRVEKANEMKIAARNLLLPGNAA
jgi:DNA replication protein DnaC